MRLLVVVKGLSNGDINVCIGLDSCDGVVGGYKRREKCQNHQFP